MTGTDLVKDNSIFSKMESFHLAKPSNKTVNYFDLLKQVESEKSRKDNRVANEIYFSCKCKVGRVG